ncbi:hypothetical protein Tco_0050581, partial [Tanacetum coccineum]
IVQLILFIVDSGCTKHMTGNLKLLCNFVEKFLGTVHFGNDQFALILSYGDLNQGNVTIKWVYYVKGLNHNLFSVGQFCDVDLEVAFRKSTCFTRLVQAVCYCARYQARPTQKHLKEVKRIFKYLKCTINMGLWYPKDSGFELTAFSDADHAGCIDTRKSTSGGIQFLGDKLVSWMSKKQNCTAMSSAEAEYVALSASCAQVRGVIANKAHPYSVSFHKGTG